MLSDSTKNPDEEETTEDLIFVPKTENEYLIKNYIDFVNQGISISNFDTGTVPESFASEKKNVVNNPSSTVNNVNKYFEQSQRKLVIPQNL